MAFQMQEIETAVRNELRPIFLVCADRQWGMVKINQKVALAPVKESFKSALGPDHEGTINTDLGEIEWNRVAEAMGAHGERVAHPDELVPALRRCLAARALRRGARRRRSRRRTCWRPALLHFKAMHAGAGRRVSGEALPYRSVLVTGAGGYIGRLLVAALAAQPRRARDDRGDRPARSRCERADPRRRYEVADVRDDGSRRRVPPPPTPTSCVHLAAIVTPGPGDSRELEYEVDVVGSRRVLEACVATGVGKLIYTSSGAAYGYHADNPEWLDEADALRGNPEFAYSDHKRQVEELLARFRVEHPELQQLVFRPGTILGARARNQITALFDGRFVLGVRGSGFALRLHLGRRRGRRDRQGHPRGRHRHLQPRGRRQRSRCARSRGFWASPTWRCRPG